MISQPALDMTSRQALVRSLGALSVFLKGVMAITSVFGGVPDWIWTPLSKLFPKIGALEDSLFNFGGDSEALAALAKQRADWDALMQERFGAKADAPPKDRTPHLIGATIPDFLEDHAIDFAIVQANAIEPAAQPFPEDSNLHLLPDHPDENGDPDAARSTDVSGSERDSASPSDSCGSGSRLSAGRETSMPLGTEIPQSANTPNPNPVPVPSGAPGLDPGRTPDSILRRAACRISVKITCTPAANAIRKPAPRARPPPSDRKTKSSAAPVLAGAAVCAARRRKF